MGRVHKYRFFTEFSSVEKARKVAQSFHEMLCGNEDYRDGNIVLTWSGNTVELYEFPESETHVRVDSSGSKLPRLIYISDSPRVSD